MDQLLVVDFDGTICFDRFWRSVDQSTMARIQALLFGHDREMIRRWMRGEHTSEEINHFIADQLDISYEDLWKIFVNDCQTMAVDLEVLAHLKSLRNRWRTLLMTDNMDCFSRFTKPTLNLDHYFDSIVNSADHGRLKGDNDGEFFVELARKIDIPLSRAILIDNSTRACDHFIKLGGQACLVTEQKTIKYWLSHLPLFV